MNMLTVASIFLCVLLTGYFILNVKGQTAQSPEQKTIEAVRADKPPVLDGKLDDPCWQKAKPITGFFSLNSDRLAEYQSIGYICYDDSHLYIGMKCLMSEGNKPVGDIKPHDTYVFLDDIVEIMIDPGYSKSDYYQLVVNAYGSTFDTFRRGGGTQHDISWNGDWQAATFIGKDFWSVEMSVPYHNLGIKPETGSTWGINLCRETRSPQDELSSIAEQGTFNIARKFAVLKGLKVDFNKYLFQIGPSAVRLDNSDNQKTALFSVPVKNMTGKTKKVKIERLYAGPDNKDAAESKTATIENNSSVIAFTESLAIAPFSPERTDAYIVVSLPKTKKLTVADADNGIILSVSLINRPWFLESMRIEVKDSWGRDMASDKTQNISFRIISLINEIILKSGEIVMTLISKETGATVTSRRIQNPSEITEINLPVKDFPWGAYDINCVFNDSKGKQLVSAKAAATVLPGGKQHIKILNNMVSELMNTKERGLVNAKEVEFMNPRKGWVYFSMSGKGNVTLDKDLKPVKVLTSEKENVEIMRQLSAGKHRLNIDGKFNDLIIRAIPELMYSCWPCDPTPFDWNGLKKEILQDCNTILGGSGDDGAMREWTAEGKQWFTFEIAPSHDVKELKIDSYVDEENYYNRICELEGFKNPLMSGGMFDQIGSASPEQKIIFAKVLSRLINDPEYNGKEFRPWYEGTVFGTDADRAYMKVVLESGGPYSFYQYLVEQSTEKQSRDQIEDYIVQTALSGDRQIPGSLRRVIVTLGDWSDITSGTYEDINPNVNFKVLMQLQMEALANNPALFGVYGVLWYYAPYVDEEITRWIGRMFRHYCIEGKTEPVTRDPYLMTHIKNPDFENETESWNIKEAESGLINVKKHPGYGSFQGRYLGGSRGDTFIVTKRSSKGPNKFSQKIKNLTADRLYSMKIITADYGNIKGEKSVNQKDGISIEMDNVEIVNIPGKNMQTTFPSTHELGRFKKDYRAYMNYHWYVFRAKSTTAELTVSDWVSPDNPGGPIGQELMYNFIEIEPYFEK